MSQHPPPPDAPDDWLFTLADFIAGHSAKTLGRSTKRLGLAHQHLIGAHLIALIDGMGDQAAFLWLDRLTDEIRTATRMSKRG